MMMMIMTIIMVLITKDTLFNVTLCIARNLLETRENIKIESHPFYHMICDWFSRVSSNFFLLHFQPKLLGYQGWVGILMITLVYSKRVSVRNNLLRSVRIWFQKVLAETLLKRISLLVFKQKWLMQLNFYFYHSIAILTDLHLIQGVFERFCNLGAVTSFTFDFLITPLFETIH